MKKYDRGNLSEAELLAVLREESAGGAPLGARARVEERIARSIAGRSTPAPFMRPRRARSSAFLGWRGVSSWISRAAWVGGVGFVAGVAAGAAGHATFTRREPVSVADTPRSVEAPVAPKTRPRRILPAPTEPTLVEDPAPAEAPAEVRAEAPAETSSAVPHVAPPPPMASAAIAVRASNAPAATADSSASTLTAERALLDHARHAFAAGEYDEAEQALGVHASRYPRGLLAEEREVLTIKVLSARGKQSEAASRAARFHERFPASLFGPSVDVAVHANP